MQKFEEFPEDGFDVVFTCDVLEHLTYKQLTENFLDHVHHIWCPKLLFICVSY